MYLLINFKDGKQEYFKDVQKVVYKKEMLVIETKIKQDAVIASSIFSLILSKGNTYDVNLR